MLLGLNPQLLLCRALGFVLTKGRFKKPPVTLQPRSSRHTGPGSPTAPSPGNACSAWATCEEPKERTMTAPSAGDARKGVAIAGEREARACPCRGLQGELCECHVLHLQLLPVIQAHAQPSHWL